MAMKLANTRVLLKCHHGSHLYGLSTPTSDLDYYEIFEYPWQKYRPRKQVSQVIKDDVDLTETSLDRFQDMCFKGIPQSLEALFAGEQHWVKYHTSWYDKRESIENNLHIYHMDIIETYKRTALNFCLKDDFKKNRHAFRLMHNSNEFKQCGRFDPTLNINTRESITRTAVLPRQRREEIFLDLFYNTFYQ